MFKIPHALLFLSALPLCAGELVVDPTGNDSSATGSPDHPFRTISAAATKAQPGDTVLVRDGIYRERVIPTQSGTPEAPITFRSEHPQGAIVRGSEEWQPVWKPFQKSTHIVAADWDQKLFGENGNPFLQAYNEDWKSGPRPPARPETTSPFPLTLGQVFVNGQPLRQCNTLEDLELAPESWMPAPDGTGLLVHFQGEPAKTIEVTTRGRIFAPLKRGLSYITVEGFLFEHCANQIPSPDMGAVSTRSGHHWIIRHNRVRYVGTIGIEMGSEGWPATSVEGETPGATKVIPAHDNLIEGNHVEHCGLAGIMGWQTKGSIVRNNLVEHNNALGFSPAQGVMVWNMAGIKLLDVKDAVVEGNLVRDNEGYGIWIDNRYRNCRITRNAVFNNLRAGIFIELGLTKTADTPEDDALIANNIVAGTRDGDGIYCHDAPGVTVAHNLIAENGGFGVRMVSATDRLAHFGPGKEVLTQISGETIRNNIFSANLGGAVSLPLPSDRSQRVICDNNLYVTGGWTPCSTTARFHFGNANWAGKHPGITAADLERLTDRYNDAAKKSPDLPWLAAAHWKNAPWLTLAQWRLVSGWDQASREYPNPIVIVRTITPEVEFRSLSAGGLPTFPPIASVTSDFHGSPMPRDKVRPGPFQGTALTNRGTIGVWPVSELP